MFADLRSPLWREYGSFTISAGPHQRSHSRVQVPWDSRQYFTVSDSRLPFSSPPTTRRTTVEVFDPASTRDKFRINYVSSLYNFGEDRICHNPNSSSIILCLYVAAETCQASRLALNYSSFQASCHNIMPLMLHFHFSTPEISDKPVLPSAIVQLQNKEI
jgi:hypothetical protein